MTRNRLIPLTAFAIGLMAFGTQALGQGACLNEALYPSEPTTPNANGTVTTIATCSFESEHSVVTGLVATGTYEFTLSTIGYITLREGAFDGPVVAEGPSPVQVVSTGADIFAHWNTNINCGTATNCVVTTVQFLLNCTPPEASVVIVEDCPNGQFSIDVTVTSIGDSPDLNIAYAVNGAPELLTGVVVGTYTLGPFFVGDLVDVVVEHTTDVLCNVNFGTLASPETCPRLILCGFPPEFFNYCYDVNTPKVWTYEASNPGTMVLSFSAGTIESTFSDQLRIYDGPDNTGTLLFENTSGSLFDLTGITLYATSGFMHMELFSDGFGSCVTGQATEWLWSVNCLNCVIPAATVTSTDDCPNNQFSVAVDVTSLGDGSTVTVVYTVNGGAAQTVPGLGLGVTNLGPFTVNDIIAVQLQHESAPECTVDLGIHTDLGTCPNLITCGAAPLEEIFCYGPNENRSWSYQAVGTGTLRLRFLRGTIESITWDNMAIYDGVDASGTQLFAHTNTLTYNLGPVGSAVNNTITNYYEVEVYSTTGNLYMELTSDGSVQCGGEFPSENFDAFEWEVVCLDCAIPVADITVIDDCAAETFTVNVDVTGTGDAATATIEYAVNGGPVETLPGVGVGATVLGPFVFGDTVNVVLAHESNSLCNIDYGNFVQTGTCPLLIACDGAFVEDSVCFGNNQDLRYYFQGTGTFPIVLNFASGATSFGDVVFVHDGADITAPILFQSGPNANLAGQFVLSTNPEHRLTLRILSDGFTSCDDGGLIEDINWEVGCLECLPPAGTFTVVQDCENFQYFVSVDVTSLGTDPELEIVNTAGVASTLITTPGVYQVGPFTSGEPVRIALVNETSIYCSITSPLLVNPLCPTILCGATPLVETYCYTNNENRAWSYATPVAGTIRLVFNRGTIESNSWDDLTIYDGSDANAPVIFVHSNSLTYNLGPDGSAVNSGGSPYYAVDVTTTTGSIYMTLTSDGSVACTSSPTSYDPWEWTVQCLGCQAPGVAYNLVPDCFGRTYMAEVIVTQAPGADGLEIVNTVTAETQVVNAVGIYQFGPYFQNDTTLFGLTDLAAASCTYFSDSLVYLSDSCVIRSCGIETYTHCYGNDEDRWYTFQSVGNVPTTIAFLQGQMLSGDRIVVYNGFDETATVIYQGTNGGNLAGFAVNSQNTDNAITLRIESNASGSCATGEATIPLVWAVGCGAVGMEELANGGFAVYPNPTEGTLFIELGNEVFGNVQVRVLDMSGRTVLNQPLNVNGGTVNTIDMKGLQAGQYMVQLTTADWVKTQRVQVSR